MGLFFPGNLSDLYPVTGIKVLGLGKIFSVILWFLIADQLSRDGNVRIIPFVGNSCIEILFE